MGAACEEDNCHKGTRGKERDKAITGRPVKMLRRTHQAPLPRAAEPPSPSASPALPRRNSPKTASRPRSAVVRLPHRQSAEDLDREPAGSLEVEGPRAVLP